MFEIAYAKELGVSILDLPNVPDRWRGVVAIIWEQQNGSRKKK